MAGPYVPLFAKAFHADCWRVPYAFMPPRPLEPGDPVRLGRFELLARLGEGGQGVVYLGRGAGPGEERVAVKVLRPASTRTSWSGWLVSWTRSTRSSRS